MSRLAIALCSLVLTAQVAGRPPSSRAQVPSSPPQTTATPAQAPPSLAQVPTSPAQVPSTPAQAQSADEQAVRAAVQQYFDAQAARDPDRAASFWSAGANPRMTRDTFVALFGPPAEDVYTVEIR